jgi:hypothetical protein
MLPEALPNTIIGHRSEHSSEQEHQLFEDKSTASRLATSEGIALCSLNVGKDLHHTLFGTLAGDHLVAEDLSEEVQRPTRHVY